MNTQSLRMAHALVLGNRVVVFGGSSTSAVPAVLQQLADTGKTFIFTLDLSKEITFREIENPNGEDFLLFTVHAKGNNTYPEFQPTVTAGAFQYLAENGGTGKFVVKLRDGRTDEKTGKVRQYYTIEPENPPVVSNQSVASAIMTIIQLQENFSPETVTETVEETADVENAE